jgi:hypothetical protein
MRGCAGIAPRRAHCTRQGRCRPVLVRPSRDQLHALSQSLVGKSPAQSGDSFWGQSFNMVSSANTLQLESCENEIQLSRSQVRVLRPVRLEIRLTV